MKIKKNKLTPMEERLIRLNKGRKANTVITLDGKHSHDYDVDYISTGIQEIDDVISGAPLDYSTNIAGTGKGWAKGRIIQIFGPESAGKTTLGLTFVKHAQKLGLKGAIVDVEHTLDIPYAAHLGVDFKDLLLSQPDSCEEALDLVIALAEEKLDFILLDSVAALVPQAEYDGTMGESQPALQARLISKFCRKVTPVISRTNTGLIVINQIRKKLNVQWGSPNTTPGGEALKFYSSTILTVTRTKTIKIKGKPAGSIVDVYCKKNKVGQPFRKVSLVMRHGEGFTSLVVAEKDSTQEVEQAAEE